MRQIIFFFIQYILISIAICDIAPCRLNDIDREDCFKDRFQSMFDIIKRRRDEENNIKQMEDFILNDINTDVGEGTITLRNTEFQNFLSAKIVQLEMLINEDTNIMTLNIDMNIPELSLTSYGIIYFFFTGTMENYGELETEGKKFNFHQLFNINNRF